MLNQIEKSYFRYQGSLRSSLLALLYCQLAYFGGFALILSLNPVLMVIGTLFLSHGMVIASYLIHDCAHNALFILPRYNALVGSVLNWLAGGCYGRFEDVRKQHMMHHVDKADVIEFDYRDYLVRHPIQRRTVEILEWLYVPAVEFIMHSMLIFAPFIFDDKKNQQLRTAGIIVIRFSALLALFIYSPIAFACYLFAIIIHLTILRFMDALQHNYAIVSLLDNRSDLIKYRGDRDYEHTHTFSNPISMKYPLLNLLTLNFGYHNAHHARPTVPWYELPKLHRSLYGVKSAVVVPFRKQLLCFHRNRVIRVMGDLSETQRKRFAQRLHSGNAVGVNGASFLTPL